jgi:hypothetical protein
LLERVAVPIGGRTAKTRTAVVIYPSERGFPDRPIVRRARMVVDASAVVLVDASGQECRRIPIGEHGVTSVAHISVSGGRPGRYGKRRPVTERAFGAVDLLDANDRPLLTVPLAAWFPGGIDDPAEPASEELHASALHRSGLAAAFAAARLPVRLVKNVNHPLFANLRSGTVPSASLRTELPRALDLTAAVVFVAGLVTVVGFTPFVTEGTLPLLLVLGGLLACVMPTCLGVHVMRLMRLDQETTPTPFVSLKPRPAGATSRRFLERAAVRLVGDEIVFADAVGAERWLPLRTPTGVAGAVVVRDEYNGQPVAVRFTTAEGAACATLDWKDWFSGTGGPGSLAMFVRACGLKLGEQSLPVPRERRTGAPVLPGIRVYRSLTRYEAQERGSHSGLPRLADFFPALALGPVVAVLALYTSRSVMTLVAGVLGALAFLMSAGPFVAAWAYQFFWWDRLVGGPPVTFQDRIAALVGPEWTPAEVKARIGALAAASRDRLRSARRTTDDVTTTGDRAATAPVTGASGDGDSGDTSGEGVASSEGDTPGDSSDTSGDGNTATHRSSATVT